MLLIKKGKEPKSLTRYRSQKGPGISKPCYDNAPAEVKNDIRKALLRDQGCLCAYCMRSISIDSMKIEHVRPRSVDYQAGNPAGTLDYARNLLGVCDEKKYARQDGEMLGSEYFTCDAKKDQGIDPEHYTPLTVDPTNPNHIDSIDYRTASGEIVSRDPQINQELNERLNLNCEKQNLPQNRHDAWLALKNKLIKEMGNGDWSRAKLKKFLENYSAVDSEGKRRPYAGILIWYIKKKMKHACRP